MNFLAVFGDIRFDGWNPIYGDEKVKMWPLKIVFHIRRQYLSWSQIYSKRHRLRTWNGYAPLCQQR